MNASVFNKTIEIPGKGPKSMWCRGPSVEVPTEGSKILGIQGLHSIRYHNGPILSTGKDSSLPA